MADENDPVYKHMMEVNKRNDDLCLIMKRPEVKLSQSPVCIEKAPEAMMKAMNELVKERKEVDHILQHRFKQAKDPNKYVSCRQLLL